ncbi:MAG: choice-of-anchor J domain-containing protein, partial [Candidatus Marinimicrobia bacterium]|nr:choice-of-anchor J domain-containing protein [Candidatus Neomarinimicrobiota bacterium]
YYNGYFKLDSLDSGNGDFTNEQGAIIKIEPNTSDISYQIYNSFENWTLAGWKNINNDGNGDSLLYFSESKNGGMDLAHSGDLGLGVQTSDGSDDWVVTNQMFLPDDNNINFSFWAKSFSSSSLQDINVKLSTTSNDVSSFSTTLASITNTPATWTEYTYDLTSYAGDSIYLAVQSINTGNYLFLDDFELIVVDNSSGTSVSKNNIPINFALKQNYPNPFNPLTTIEYSIPQNSFVKISVYNLRGEKIKTVVNENKIAGNYSVIFDGSNFASGIYFYKIEAENYSNTKKFILMK